MSCHQSTRTPVRSTALARALANLARERRWLAEHGQNLSGYIARYGRATDPDRYGDGGEAIYAADLATVERAEARVRELGGVS